MNTTNYGSNYWEFTKKKLIWARKGDNIKNEIDYDNKMLEKMKKENKGSCFSYTIKFKKDLNKADVPVSKIEDLQVDLADNLDSKLQNRILIVDDNRINQVVTKRILEQKSFVCEIAQDGHEAVEKVKNTAFDLVLMDVNMPGITGMEATQQIRKFNEEIPIVALTAVEVEEIREEIHSAGMNDIIVKPYDVQQFYRVGQLIL